MGQQLPEPLRDLVAAVHSEIAASRRDSGDGAEKVVLQGGRRVSGGERSEYLFTCRSWRDSLNGRPVLVRLERSQQPWSTADATRLPDGRIRVTTSTDLGPNPASVLLREDDASNWMVLAERLEAAGQAGSPVDPAKSGQVLGLSTPTLSRVPDAARLVGNWRTLQLNPAQRAAVEQALGSSVLFLWGPPGTGKTDVVSHIAEGCYRQGLNACWPAASPRRAPQAVSLVLDVSAGQEGFR